MHNLGLDYLRINEPDSALFYIREGIKKSLKAKDSFNYYTFVNDAGVAYYLKGKYKIALDSINKSSPYHFISLDEKLNYYFYKLKLAEALKNNDTLFFYFQKLDSIYIQNKKPIRELPEAYESIINYYKRNNDLENQLKYTNRLLEIDSIIEADLNFLDIEITKNYDIPLIVSEKENLISQLKNEKRTTNLGLGIAVSIGILLGGGFFYYYRKQRFYKRRFEEILSTKPSSKSQIPNSRSLKGISKEVIEQIQKGLNHFENKKEFLDSSITLNSLSKTLNTNSNYLSKVINFNKQKNFSNYLNDLRIEYAIEQLKNNPQFRKYSVKGMAQEVGFNSAESFSKAFYKRSGLYPSYFLKQLEKTV